MTYLAGLRIIGVRALFIVIGWVLAGSISYWTTVERGGDGKMWQPQSRTLEVSYRWNLASFVDSAQLHSFSTFRQIQDKLHKNVNFIAMCHR
jgi:hypothetical protein